MVWFVWNENGNTLAYVAGTESDAYAYIDRQEKACNEHSYKVEEVYLNQEYKGLGW